LRHGEELHSLLIEGMIEGTRSKGRLRMKYMMHESLLQGTQRRMTGEMEKTFVVKRKLLKTNLQIEKKIYIYI